MNILNTDGRLTPQYTEQNKSSRSPSTVVSIRSPSESSKSPKPQPEKFNDNEFNDNEPKFDSNLATINEKVVPGIKKNAFVHKLYTMLSDKSLLNLIWWNEDNELKNTFSLMPGKEFSKILTNFFKHGNVASFVRQLHMYGFHKVNDTHQVSNSNDNQVWEFKHSSGRFKKDDEEGLIYIKRRSSSNSNKSSNQANPPKLPTDNVYYPMYFHDQMMPYVPYQVYPQGQLQQQLHFQPHTVHHYPHVIHGQGITVPQHQVSQLPNLHVPYQMYAHPQGHSHPPGHPQPHPQGHQPHSQGHLPHPPHPHHQHSQQSPKLPDQKPLKEPVPHRPISRSASPNWTQDSHHQKHRLSNTSPTTIIHRPSNASPTSFVHRASTTSPTNVSHLPPTTSPSGNIQNYNPLQFRKIWNNPNERPRNPSLMYDPLATVPRPHSSHGREGQEKIAGIKEENDNDIKKDNETSDSLAGPINHTINNFQLRPKEYPRSLPPSEAQTPSHPLHHGQHSHTHPHASHPHPNHPIAIPHVSSLPGSLPNSLPGSLSGISGPIPGSLSGASITDKIRPSLAEIYKFQDSVSTNNSIFSNTSSISSNSSNRDNSIISQKDSIVSMKDSIVSIDKFKSSPVVGSTVNNPTTISGLGKFRSSTPPQKSNSPIMRSQSSNSNKVSIHSLLDGNDDKRRKLSDY